MSNEEGKVTAETILKLCRDMSNDKVSVSFRWAPSRPLFVSVDDDRHKNIYIVNHFGSEEVKLIDIYQDLIKIQNEYTGERNE